MKKGKVIIISAPSGSGKSTIIKHLMAQPELRLVFSISATTRSPRGQEQHGRDYYFISPDEFRALISQNAFVEYEQVYAGIYYGTLKDKVERQLAEGYNVVVDLDVNGGERVKALYGDRALSLFIQPPSIEVVRQRLEGRATEAPEDIEKRIERAAYELSRAPHFDRVVVNDKLADAQAEAYAIINQFVNGD